MHSDEQQDDQQDEVSFWQDLIRQWEATQAGPVPQRMREALELARERWRWAEEAIQRLTDRLH